MLPYAYRPLLPATNSVRLVQILPGEAGSDIHCRIIDYTIRDDQASGLFEALSYVWGDPTITQRIYITFAATSTSTGGLSEQPNYMDVTENLFAALQRLRDGALPRLMWIDAICINQTDLDERASQVKFMAKIYSYAMRVVVWLGEGHSDDEDIFPVLEDAALHPQSILTQGPRARPYACSSPLDLEDTFEREIPEASLLALVDRPWFSRVWILQEVAAARHVLMICGGFEITGSTFAKALPILSRLVRPSWSLKLCQEVAQIMDRTTPMSRCVAEDTEPDSEDPNDHYRLPVIGELLDRFRTQKATDERDKIFALLGMASDGTAELLTPDYTKLWGAVFADLISHILGPSSTTFTSDSSRLAICTVKGCALGLLQADYDSKYWGMESAHWRVAGYNSRIVEFVYWWPDNPYCREIKDGDIVFLASGARNPIIIRPCSTHFDIIVIAMPEPLKMKPTEQERKSDQTPLFKWCDFLQAVSHDQSEVTLVWDWSAPRTEEILHQPLDTKVIRLLDDCIPRTVRLYRHGRLFDSLYHGSDKENLLSDDTWFEKQDHCTELAPLQVLRTAWSHWRTYSWLQGTVEKLRWTSWYIQHPTVEPFSGDSILTYWKECGYSCQDWFAIQSFLDKDILPLVSGGIQDKLNFTDLYETQDDAFYSAIFPPRLHPHRDASGASGALIWSQGSVLRSLVKLTLAQCSPLLDKLPMVTETLSTATTCELPGDMLPALALISEAQDGILSLNYEVLMRATGQFGFQELFSSLLRILYKDVFSAYNIFATMIERTIENIAHPASYRRRSQSASPTIPNNVESASDLSSTIAGELLAPGGDTDFESSSWDDASIDGIIAIFGRRPLWDKCDPGWVPLLNFDGDEAIHFFDTNIPTLKKHIEHTNLYEYAAAIDGDLLLPCLHARYTARLNEHNGELSRDALIRGLIECETVLNASSER